MEDGLITTEVLHRHNRDMSRPSHLRIVVFLDTAMEAASGNRPWDL